MKVQALSGWWALAEKAVAEKAKAMLVVGQQQEAAGNGSGVTDRLRSILAMAGELH